MFSCFDAQQDHLLPALAEAQEQRQLQRAEQQPVRDMERRGFVRLGVKASWQSSADLPWRQLGLRVGG